LQPVDVLAATAGAHLGVGFDAGAWDRVLRRLRRRFRLMVLDNRGVGGSEPPSGWYSVATMGADVVSVLDAQRIPAAHVQGVAWVHGRPQVISLMKAAGKELGKMSGVEEVLG